MKDLLNKVDLKPVIYPSAGPSDNTAQVGQIIDRQGYDSLTYVIQTGTLVDADATFAVLLEEGAAANLSDASTVAAADLIGTAALAGFTFADDNKVRKLGYKGAKRYTRLTITPANNTGAAPMSAVAVLASGMLRPTANPPV
jgi:hypothetical protein